VAQLFSLGHTTRMELPDTMTRGASLEGSEYGWRVDDFPRVLADAAQRGLACVGGQFQFRLPEGATCEMYWLCADASPRRQDETWSDYVSRCRAEVEQTFRRLCDETDFRREAVTGFDFLRAKCDAGFDPLPHLYFVAYFDHEPRVA